MAGSSMLHLAVFAAGAAIGAATAVTITGKRKIPAPVAVANEPQAVVVPKELGIAKSQLAISGDILKYGNPGTF